jgi:hypothetical protein
MDLTLVANADATPVPGLPPADLNVMHGRLRVGRISRHNQMPGAKYIWVVSIYDGPDEMRRSGTAPTPEEASAAITNSWRQWLAWAGLSEQEAALQESPSFAADSEDEDPLAAVLREAHLAARFNARPVSSE